MGAGDILAELTLKDVLFSISFNLMGDKFVTTCKDKKVRIHDARTLEVLQVGTTSLSQLLVLTSAPL